MVLKTSKPGHAGLNTGRTLRGSGRLPGRRYAFIRCCEAGADAAEQANAAAVRQPAAAAVTNVAASIERSQLDFRFRDLSIELLPDGVEYSLNKKSRWETAERIRYELQALAEEAECEVQLFEHHLRPRWGTSGRRTCTAFYSSGGAGKPPKSKSAPGQRYMNAGSLANEQRGGRSRKRRSQRNRRRSTDENDDQSGGETQDAGNRRHQLALACDLVRSVPSGSSAVYPARQGQAKRQKLAGRYCRNANDVTEMVSDYLRSDLSYDDFFCSDDESIADDDGYCQPSSDGRPVDTVSAAFEDRCTEAVADSVAIHTAHTANVLSERGKVSSQNEDHECCAKPDFTTNTHTAEEVGISSDPKLSADVQLTVVQLGGKEMRVLRIKDAKQTCSQKKSSRQQKQHKLGRSNYSVDNATNDVSAVHSLAVDGSSIASLTLRILPRDDGSSVMEQLSSAFGEFYSDCRCQPHMCSVELRDISQKISLVCRCRPKHNQLIAYLVVQEEACQSDTYNVWLSANVQGDQTLVGTLKAAEAYTLQELLENVEAYLLSLPHECFATEPLNSTIHYKAAPSRAITSLYDTRRWSVACQTLDDVQQKVAAGIAKLEEENERNSKDSQENLLRIPLVAQRSLSAHQNQCGACFEEIGPERAVKGAALTQCGHSFCLDCWWAYLSGKVKEGRSVLQCPEYRCPAVVDFATILAICGPDVARCHRMKQAEVIVWKEGNVTWCPNPWCKRLVRVKCDIPKAEGRGEAVSISCLCGRSFCFSCRGEPHWPLTCEQASNYHLLLKQKGLFTSEQLSSASILVRTKPCPGCQYPIEKWTGCNRMTCSRCSATFCWRCLEVLQPSSAYEHVMPCHAPLDTDLEEHEFSNAAVLWSRRSASLASKALESRRYNASAVARRLERQLVAVLARAELQTLKNFAELTMCSASSIDSASLTKRLATHLLKSVLAFKLDAHRIEEYSLACLAMGPRRLRRANAALPVLVAAGKGTSDTAAATRSGPAAADTSRQMTRKRAVAELTRLSIAFGQLEAMLLNLSSADSAKPTLDDLLRLDGFPATVERRIRSIVTLMAALQGF